MSQTSVGTSRWINKAHSSTWIYSYSTIGTETVMVEDRWPLGNWPKHSVPKTQTTIFTQRSEVSQCHCMLSFYTLSPMHELSDNDITKWHQNHLLPQFSRKSIAHAQESCTDPPVHLLASPLFSTAMHEPCHHFLNLNFKPVTLSPRYFGAPSYQSLEFIYKTCKDWYRVSM